MEFSENHINKVCEILKVEFADNKKLSRVMKEAIIGNVKAAMENENIHSQGRRIVQGVK